MIIHGIPVNTQKRWSTLKKLMWYRLHGSGGSLPWATFTGNPLQFAAPKAHTLRSVKVEFSPIQDLHGYANPWPAGGGKNIIPTTLSLLKARNTTGQWNNNVYSISGLTYTVNTDGTITVNGTSSADVYFNFVKSDSPLTITAGNYIIHATGSANINMSIGKNGSYWGEAKTSNTSLTADADSYITIYSYVASGKQLTNFVLKPMFESGSTASAWQPYSNICPISGWTGANVYDTGENLFTTEGETEGRYLNDYGESLRADGWIHSDYIPVSPNTQYTFTPNTTAGGSAKTWYYDSDKNGISYIDSGSQSFTTPSNCHYMRFSYRDTSTDITLNLGSTASPYSPYTGETLAVTWTDEGTVYGGYLTVAEDGSVDLVRDRALFTVTSAKIAAAPEHGWNSTYGAWVRNLNYSEGITREFFNGSDTVPCTAAVCVVNNKGISSSQFRTSFNFDGCNSYADFENAVATLEAAGTPLSYVALLNTPVTYHLDSVEQLTALVGINTMWSDTNGDLTVEARAESVQLNALQSLNMLLGGRYYNNGTADEPTDEESLRILMGGER